MTDQETQQTDTQPQPPLSDENQKAQETAKEQQKEAWPEATEQTTET